MKALNEERDKINIIKQNITKTWVLTLFLLTSLFYIGTIQAQNYNTFPNANHPPKALTLQELNLQKQIQIQQQNRQQMEKFGSQPPPTQQQQTWDYYDKQTFARQQKEKELYKLINSTDNQTNSNLNPKVSEETNLMFLIADTNSAKYKNYALQYNLAFNEISDMLSGKKELCLKRAVFIVENAYHQNKLDYVKYDKQINELVLLCTQFLKKKRLKKDNSLAIHYAIQYLFSETLSYDFDDYMGTNDFTKMFVTKLLNTKTGQCHSLPLLYLILAEELKINAYLGLAPNHSYIIFGNQNQSYNFETTNGSFSSDQWIVASGYISSTAVKNEIYLTPLNKKEVIAECLVDLATGLEFLSGKSNFTHTCAKTALNYFPNCINSLLIMNNLIVAQCCSTAKKYNFPKESDYHKYKDLKEQFDKMVEFELLVEQTGYIKIPTEQYELWQQTINEVKQQQEHLKFSDKLQKSVNEK